MDRHAYFQPEAYHLSDKLLSLLSVYSKRNHALLGLAVMIVLLSQVAIMHFLKSSNVTLTSAIKRTRKVKEIRVRVDRE